jgi:hypothetical protein
MRRLFNIDLVWLAQEHGRLEGDHIPIITGSRRSDTDDESIEVKLPESWVGPPVDALQVRSLSLSNFDIGTLVGNRTDLRLELVGETHDARLLMLGDFSHENRR